MAESQSKRFEWLQSPRALLNTILRLDDTPQSIALGTAIGMFVGLTPMVGLQMAIVLLKWRKSLRFFWWQNFFSWEAKRRS